MSAKNKLNRFAENKTFENVVQPKFDEVFNIDYKLKGEWNNHFFKNNNPIVLELGCGKGEYTVNLAKMFPNKNFIGIDIKGARFWRGAKTATEEKIPNVGFIRTKIEFLESFFAKNEISEIWITFPDPQLEKRRTKKRLTSQRFLNMYYHILSADGLVHLKTDSQELHEYTKSILSFNSQEIIESNNDIYNTGFADDVLSIKTHYEQDYLRKGKTITYLKFSVRNEIIEVPETEELLS